MVVGSVIRYSISHMLPKENWCLFAAIITVIIMVYLIRRVIRFTHCFNVIKFSSVLYLFLHTKHYIRNNIMIILHHTKISHYTGRHWTREQDDHPHFWPLPAMAIITNFIETMKILCGQLNA